MTTMQRPLMLEHTRPVSAGLCALPCSDVDAMDVSHSRIGRLFLSPPNTHHQHEPLPAKAHSKSNFWTEDCVAAPWTSGCEGFELDHVVIDLALTRLCSMMNWMPGEPASLLYFRALSSITHHFIPGCSVRTICATTNTNASICNPFSLLSDICATDMPGMKPCAQYVSMCGPENSLVRQCKQYPPMPHIPTTKQAKTAVSDICEEMRMDGCELCVPAVPPTPLASSSSARSSQLQLAVANCDYLSVYAGLCLAMPDMVQCAQWRNMCSESPAFPLCPKAKPSPGGPQSPPMMQMYFHFAIAEYLLFKFWVPRTAAQYVLACLFVFLSGLGFEWMLAFQRRWDRTAMKRYQWLARTVKQGNGIRSRTTSNTRFASPSAEGQPLLPQGQLPPQVPVTLPPLRRRGDVGNLRMEMLQIRLLKGVGRACVAMVGYCVMLLVMTYNVGICVSVVAGLGTGSFLFFFNESDTAVDADDEVIDEGEHLSFAINGDKYCGSFWKH
ncbi:Ctr copper transporter family-domain-containing protein [Chytriomyces sp. MP71]|nr:Ctr copper transporter family-domain-containing protein [Chytriomyces sp. MP71]